MYVGGSAFYDMLVRTGCKMVSSKCGIIAVQDELTELSCTHAFMRLCLPSMQVTAMEQGHGDTEAQLQEAKSEAKKLRDELSSTSSRLKEAQTQIDQLHKVKGAAMRNNASSYQQSIQLESQVERESSHARE